MIAARIIFFSLMALIGLILLGSFILFTVSRDEMGGR